MTKGLQRSLSRGPKSTRGMVTERLVLNEQLAFTGSTGAEIFSAIPAADAEVSADVRAENATQAVIDNTDGSGELNLNVLLDADEVTDGETLNVSVTGTLDVAYTVLGDD